MRLRYYILALALPLLLAACSRVEEMGVEEPDSRKVSFDVSVSRGDGSVKTKGSYDVGVNYINGKPLGRIKYALN